MPPNVPLPPTPPGRWLRRWWMWVPVLCAAAAAAWLLLVPPVDSRAKEAKSGPAAAMRALPVAAVPARTSDAPVYLNGLGTVVPRNTVTVRSRVDGQLMRVLFREGQIVKAGDLLAEIDPRPFQVQLDQAQGQLEHDEALLKNARLDLERYKVLVEQDSIPRQQLDTQDALVRQYEGAVRSDRAQIDNAKLQLVYCRITSPIGGRVGLRLVDPGNIVHAADTSGMVVVTQMQPITVVFPIPEDSLPAVVKRLRSGEKLPVDAFDRAGTTKLAIGTLLTIDNQIDPTTGMVKLKAEFPNDDGALFPNQFVNARMLVDTRRGATVVPSAAIQRGVQGTYVYVVKDDRTVSVRPVKLGPVEGETAVLETGVAPGEVVVVDGADKLREGARVDLIAKNAGAPAGAPKEGATADQRSRP